MLEERVKVLINAAVDGELSDAERSELNEQLEHSPDARRFHASMERFDAFLTNLPEAALPEQLHEQILTRIKAPETAARAPRFSRPQLPALLRYGLAAAAGLVVAVGMYEIQPQPGGPQDLDHLVGTMVAPPAAAVVLDRYAFEHEGLKSDARIELRDGALVLDLTVDSAQQVDLEVSVDGDSLVFGALEQSKGRFGSFEFSHRSIRASGRGRQVFSVLLDRVGGSDNGMEATIRLEYSGREGLIQERVLRPDLGSNST